MWILGLLPYMQLSEELLLTQNPPKCLTPPFELPPPTIALQFQHSSHQTSELFLVVCSPFHCVQSYVRALGANGGKCGLCERVPHTVTALRPLLTFNTSTEHVIKS